MCITDGTDSYRHQERCTVRATQALSVSASGSSHTESYHDWITIGGTRYSGTSGPSNVIMAAGQTLHWHTDGSQTRSGWTICATPSPATPSPSPQPSLPLLSPSPPYLPLPCIFGRHDDDPTYSDQGCAPPKPHATVPMHLTPSTHTRRTYAPCACARLHTHHTRTRSACACIRMHMHSALAFGAAQRPSLPKHPPQRLPSLSSPFTCSSFAFSSWCPWQGIAPAGQPTSAARPHRHMVSK
jgi:hypothetical protein